MGRCHRVQADALANGFADLKAPCTVVLESDEPENCGNDHVVAVNLTRPLDSPPDRGLVERAMREICKKYRKASSVEITHFIGGPCQEEELMCCVVLGGGGCGWTAANLQTICSRVLYSVFSNKSPQ
ncbi:unnamed protein product [Durusdinium trenchii]|uniref:Uncharacterized protein n=1 Tax=Durusdinium trenchii TaxID=1381693 RepID=A0ABP0P9Z8_9DINO